LLAGAATSVREVNDVVLVGNTVMHHLFCGISVEPLSHYPFVPASPGLQVFDAEELGWSLPGHPAVRFLPCLGSFVGSDILAGLLATQLHRSERVAALIDLGTNGEIVVGNRDRLLCASTAAGPAFEGARISMGMRAATGAISEVRVRDGRLECHVLGNVAPRGVCGSGLVDAVAALAGEGRVQPTGRFHGGVREFELTPGVVLAQADIRELQLAKGAIAAGALMLRKRLGADPPARFHLAGAFGNYVRAESAKRIGLLPLDSEVVPEGNAALRGTRLLLLRPVTRESLIQETLDRTEHVELGGGSAFQDAFALCMRLAPLGWSRLDEV